MVSRETFGDGQFTEISIDEAAAIDGGGWWGRVIGGGVGALVGYGVGGPVGGVVGGRVGSAAGFLIEELFF